MRNILKFINRRIEEAKVRPLAINDTYNKLDDF